MSNLNEHNPTDVTLTCSELSALKRLVQQHVPSSQDAPEDTQFYQTLLQQLESVPLSPISQEPTYIYITEQEFITIYVEIKATLFPFQAGPTPPGEDKSHVFKFLEPVYQRMKPIVEHIYTLGSG